MGTAVLFPEDCLRSRSRPKKHLPGMIYPHGSALKPKRNRPASSQSLEAGLLPLPGRTRSSFPMGVPRRESDPKQMKVRKVSVPDENSPLSTISPDLPVHTILQRPKDGESAAELLARFVMLDNAALIDGVRGSQIEDGGVYRCDDSRYTRNGAVGMEIDAHKLKHRAIQGRITKLSDAGWNGKQALAVQKKPIGRSAEGLHFASVEGFKHSKNGSEEKLRARSAVVVAAKPYMPERADKSDLCAKPMVGHDGEELENSSKSSACLRRTTTEPLFTKHIAGQYTKNLTHFSGSRPKLEVHANCHELCETGVTLSCEERWAGPAYSSSPPPSSLPLPKLCLPHVKMTNVEIPSLVKQYSTSVYMESCLQPSAPSVVACVKAGAWDVAFATKNLRRLLNLDPCQ